MSDDIYLYRLVSVDIAILEEVEKWIRSWMRGDYDDEADKIAGVIKRAKENKYQEVK